MPTQNFSQKGARVSFSILPVLLVVRVLGAATVKNPSEVMDEPDDWDYGRSNNEGGSEEMLSIYYCKEHGSAG